MKKIIRLMSLLMTALVFSAVFAGCSGKLTLQEYIDQPTIRKQLDQEIETQKKALNGAYDDIKIYVESETKLVYDFKYSPDMEIDVTYVRSLLSSESFKTEYNKVVKDIRKEMGVDNISVIARFRNSSGAVIAEQEFNP